MQVVMTVLRDGYWDGQYPRQGDTIMVEAGLVDSLEVAGFAMRCSADARPPRVVPGSATPGRKHHGAGR
jgi:hypothetical protein